MKISDRPEFQSKPAPLTCAPDEAVLNASKRMAERNYGSIIALGKQTQHLAVAIDHDDRSVISLRHSLRSAEHGLVGRAGQRGGLGLKFGAVGNSHDEDMRLVDAR